MTQSEPFTFPIGIRLFNRPEYTEQFLQSLANQTVQLDPKRIICFIDGYPKSTDYHLKVPDRTSEVLALVKHYFPEAIVIHPEVNAGLAQALYTLQTQVFDLPHSDWGVFLEDDLVLDADYLETLLHLTKISAAIPDVVKVAACQTHTGYLKSAPAPSRKNFFLGEGTKAIAERRDYFFTRKQVTEQYLASLAGVAYRHRDRAKVFSVLAQSGIVNVMGNNDGVQDQMVAFFGRLHIVVDREKLTDIGLVGESHFVIPEVPVPHARESNILSLTEADLQLEIAHLHEELRTIQDSYFQDLWQVYRRAESIKHTVKFLGKKSMAKILKKVKR